MWQKGKNGSSGGGGSATITVLWTNPRRTENFSGQTVTLSQNIDNFDYIEIQYLKSTSSTNKYSITLTPQELSNTSNSTFKFTLRPGISTMARVFYFSASNKIYFGAGQGQSGAANNLIIPWKINGIKWS